MLIGISPLIGPDLLRTLAVMGHGDEIAFVDANYPAEEHARRLLRADGIGLTDLLAGVLPLFPLDPEAPAILRTGEGNDPAGMADIHHRLDALCARLAPDVTVHPLSGAAFYPRVRAAHAVVATGERALYANVILRKGIVAP